MHTTTFFPAPGAGRLTVAISAPTPPGGWWYLRGDLAEAHDCYVHDIDLAEIAWADGERITQFVVVRGRIVGSLDDYLTKAEWDEVLLGAVSTAAE
jgi:hypothetical protein